jgi:hypothetical protein
MASPEIEAIRRAIAKRGIKKDDLYFHECTQCNERAVEKYVLISRLGGRDIDLCVMCGHARSWTRNAASEDRTEEVPFDLKAFLRM